MSLKKIKRIKRIFTVLFITVSIISIACCLIAFASLSSTHSLNLNNTFTVNIPPNISYEKADYVISKEITQHYILQGSDDYSSINGYIQVWNLKSPITDYIKQAEENLSASVYNYEKKPVLQNGSTGFDISFAIKGDNGNTFVRQTIWQRDNNMYVISLSAPDNTEQIAILDEVFDKIKKSVTLSGDSLPSGKLVEYCIQDI
ncbi:MAG: hypothetical protein IJZ94_05565 [Clostridia bacterium]|nr:hypothetical protein [Clostridia bacterium]